MTVPGTFYNPDESEFSDNSCLIPTLFPSLIPNFSPIFPEVQFRPYRTDDFITRLYYETPRLTVLNQTWVLKARVNDSERNPNLSCKRTLSFQLILKSKVNSPMECSFLLLEGPYDDVKINPVIYHFVFSNESNETDYMALPIVDSVECNKLLAAKNINLRLFIFQIQK
ncbi:cysteine and histidine-rich protein 1 [Passer montanus]|uniref:cysteine and histidine-rich protein 1 n=1 Tax=Passer montanus TaxID=9160 RepID=UPI00195F5B69|nr:cysteine and histidine-rich protein 1 [Passer montanus]